jgi:hypothetical protein
MVIPIFGCAQFRIDVTFEMRTAFNSESFIQLIIFSFTANHFISKVEVGGESQIPERKRESKGESASVGVGGQCAERRLEIPLFGENMCWYSDTSPFSIP